MPNRIVNLNGKENLEDTEICLTSINDETVYEFDRSFQLDKS